MANDILKAIEKIGYKSVLDVNGKPVVSHDDKRYLRLQLADIQVFL